MAGCASGQHHSLFIDKFGSVWGCGYNGDGQLGTRNSFDKVNKPEKINNLEMPISSISAGYQFSLFLDVDRSVWTCGSNANGQLGLGDTESRNIPVKIPNIPKIISIFALGNASIFLDEEGSVWSCGSNQSGELGLGDNMQRNKAEKIAGLPKIKSIAGGWSHSLFLDCEGFVWSCGYNKEGNLGLGDTICRSKPERVDGLPKIKWIAAGTNISLFGDKEGKVWVCGGNKQGELGLGHETQMNKPEKILSLSGIVSATGGWFCSIFLDQQGKVFTCGNNPFGQLGHGDTTNRSTPQQLEKLPPISYLSTCNTAYYFLQIVDCEGNVWSSGFNENGQLGLGDQYQRCTFERIVGIPTLKGTYPSKQKIAANPTEELIVHLPSEKEIFTSLNQLLQNELPLCEESKQLKARIMAEMKTDKLNDEEVKEKLVTGVIELADWTSKWEPIHKKNQELTQSIEQNKLTLEDLQNKLAQLKEEISNKEQAVSAMVEQKQLLEFYDVFLQPIASVQAQLKSGYDEKLGNRDHQNFSVDEVSLFLIMNGIEELLTHQREKQMDGKWLDDAIYDVTAMEIQDRLTKRKMEFYLKVLNSGKMKEPKELDNCMVWRHRDFGMTLKLLKEYSVELDAELLRSKQICIYHLLYFKVKDFQKELGLEVTNARQIVRQLLPLKTTFEENLSAKSQDSTK